MNRPFGKSSSWSDQPLIPPSVPHQPPPPDEPTGVWAMDPFMECDFMIEHYASCSKPEVFGRSVSEAVEEPPAEQLVEPDPVIMGLPKPPESDDEGEEVRPMTMWMRIEEENKRRALETAVFD